MNETRMKVAECFPDLDPSFLDEGVQVEGAPASRAEGTAGPSSPAT